MRIALDSMGGDNGPKELVSGALLALEHRRIEVVLVGDRKKIESCLDRAVVDEEKRSRLKICHSTQVVEMSESPVEATRKKKDSSVMVAFDLIRNGKVDAAVSAGNSGATLATAVRKLGRIKQVSRPGIAGIFPTLKKPVVMMDVGANVDCRPEHLLQFGVMASSFSKVLQIENPRVGLLSIGEETGKGNALVKEASILFDQSSLNFVGNVEGRDVFQGDVDVVVCDGFVGNISLKISEGLAEAMMSMLGAEIKKSWISKLGYLLARPSFKKFKKRVDYAEYGGAPLLGVDGVGYICHGKSNALAIKNAILGAAKMVDCNVNQEIVINIARHKEKAKREILK